MFTESYQLWEDREDVKLYTYLHENDVLILHHSDSFCEPIVHDMAEIGIDVWQGVLPSNDIRRLTEELDGKMALMGGISSTIDRVDVTRDEIDREVERCLKEYGDLPYFIPAMTYGGPGSLFDGVEDAIIEDIDNWNKEHYPV